MLFQSLKRIISALLLTLLLATNLSPVAQAENSTSDMTFTLDFVQDINKYFVFTVGCNNNTLDTINSVYAYFPFNKNLEYKYYSSSNANSYVRRVVPERLEINFGDVKSGPCSPVRVFFKRINNAKGTWTAAVIGHYDGEPTPDGVPSNPVTVDLDGTGANNPTPTLAGGGTVQPGQTLTFTGQGYVANELVSLWYNLPDGRVLPVSPIATLNASDKGTIQFTLQLPTDITNGSATVVAYGQTSHLTSIGYLTVSKNE